LAVVAVGGNDVQLSRRPAYAWPRLISDGNKHPGTLLAGETVAVTVQPGDIAKVR